jgi:phosphatidylserine/phosphatidylglycerophosphate/cardiolipin synthase-like enzyme
MKRKLFILLTISIFSLWVIGCGKSTTTPTTTTTTTSVTTTSSTTTISFPSGSIEILFSPRGGCTDEIIRQIDNAVSYIDVAMYSFTSDPIAQALVNARGRGVEIRVLMDKQQASTGYSKHTFLANNGILVSLDTHSGYMHNKVAIMDQAVVITGSFNWSVNAEENNQENMLVIMDPGVVQIYQDRFDYLWEYNSDGIITPIVN